MSRLQAGEDYLAPTPTLNIVGDVECGFFAARECRWVDGRITQMTLQVLLLVSDGHWLAFRIEPAQQGTHAYGHVQLCQHIFGKSLPVPGDAHWLPTSYPAFPTGTSRPVDMFLYMMASLHGHAGGATSLLESIFPDRVQMLRDCISALARQLVVNADANH
jgi:hypothetical protein